MNMQNQLAFNHIYANFLSAIDCGKEFPDMQFKYAQQCARANICSLASAMDLIKKLYDLE